MYEKKKILIHAFISNNLGDDLLVKMLCERYPKQAFVISLEGISSKTLRSISNLRFSMPLYILKKFIVLEGRLKRHLININIFSKLEHSFSSKYEIGVYIAGSIFVQNAQKYIDKTILHNRHQMHEDFLIIGANFGPYHDPRYRDFVEDQFKSVNDVCFRDSASKKFFANMVNVRWAPDVVFGLEYPIRKVKKKVVISIIKCDRSGRPNALASQADVYEIVIKNCCAILSQLGYTVCLMSFCEKQGDGETVFNIDRRCKEAGISNVSVYHYKGDVDEALEIIAESERVIATRFHMMILGWVMKKPVFPLVYDQKMTRVLEDTGFFPGKKIIELKRDEAPEIVRTLLALLPVDCAMQSEESVKQFAGLDFIIGGGIS